MGSGLGQKSSPLELGQLTAKLAHTAALGALAVLEVPDSWITPRYTGIGQPNWTGRVGARPQPLRILERSAGHPVEDSHTLVAECSISWSSSSRTTGSVLPAVVSPERVTVLSGGRGNEVVASDTVGTSLDDEPRGSVVGVARPWSGGRSMLGRGGGLFG